MASRLAQLASQGSRAEAFILEEQERNRELQEQLVEAERVKFEANLAISLTMSDSLDSAAISL